MVVAHLGDVVGMEIDGAEGKLPDVIRDGGDVVEAQVQRGEHRRCIVDDGLGKTMFHKCK